MATDLSKDRIKNRVSRIKETISQLESYLAPPMSLSAHSILDQLDSSHSKLVDDSQVDLNLNASTQASNLYDSFETKLAEKDKMINELTKIKEELCQQIQHLQKTLSKALEETSTYRSNYIELNTKLKEISPQELEQIKLKLIDIEIHHQQTISKIKRFDQEINEKDNRILLLEEENKRLQQDIEHVIQENTQIKDEIDDLDLRYKVKIEKINSILETFTGTGNSFVNDLKELFDVQHDSDLFREVYLLKKKESDASLLTNKLSEVLIQLSPRDSFEGNKPTSEQIWVWFSNLLSQYMELKLCKEGQTLTELSVLARVPPSKLVEAWNKLIH